MSEWELSQRAGSGFTENATARRPGKWACSQEQGNIVRQVGAVSPPLVMCARS